MTYCDSGNQQMCFEQEFPCYEQEEASSKASLEVTSYPPTWICSSLDLLAFWQYCKLCLYSLGFWGVRGQKIGDVSISFIIWSIYVFVRVG